MSVTFSIIGHRNENDPNFSNVNARQICDILGIFPEYLYGNLSLEKIDRVIRLATLAINKQSADYGYEPFDKTPHIHWCGTTDESVRRRLSEILNLCIKAKRLGKEIVFG